MPCGYFRDPEPFLEETMNIAYIFVPHFPVAVEQREDPSLEGKAVVIGGLAHEMGTVYEASPEAVEQQVQIGMSLRQAEELCPQAIFLPLREDRYTSASEEMLVALEPFSPFIEPYGLGAAHLEVSGLLRLYGLDERLGRSIATAVNEATHLPVRVGIARNKFTARIAALESAGEKVQVIAPGQERRFLKELPVALLPISREMRERLHLLGIRTMGQLASLPGSAVLAQFGLEGKRAHQLALGKDGSKIVARRQQGPQELEFRFEDPVEEMQALQTMAKQLSVELLTRLHYYGRLCGRVGVTLEYDTGQEEEKHVSLSEPSAEEYKIGLAVERLVSSFHYQDRVSALKVSLGQLTQGKGHQLSLFSTRTLRQRRIDRAVASIVGKYGPLCFLQARLLDLRAALPERRFALLQQETPWECIAMKRRHEQALPTSTKYRVHEWR
jgi:DNA polymerase-4